MIYIGTHIMPWEIGEFRHQTRLHKLTLLHLPKEILKEIVLIPTLNLNDKILDWDNSELSKEYYIKHFEISCKTLEDIIEIKPRIGGVASTTEALKKNIEEIITEKDHYLWLDPDISYPYTFWKVLWDSFEVVRESSDHFIITPSTPKMWDSSWDVLVNEDQMNLPYSYKGWYESNFDEYFYPNQDPSLLPTPTIKFAGGHGNFFTGKTLKLFGIPDDYTLYGGIDTYIMLGAEHLRKQNKLTQYRIKNIVTIQDFKFSDKEMYKSFTPSFITKDSQRVLNEEKNKIFQYSVQSLINKLQ